MCSGGQNLTLHILVFAFRGISFFPPGFPSFIKTPPAFRFPFSIFRFLCPPETGGRRGSLEEALNVLLYPLMGEKGL